MSLSFLNSKQLDATCLPFIDKDMLLWLSPMHRFQSLLVGSFETLLT